MNGIDAVVLATGNDFRAVEAGAHAYAAEMEAIQAYHMLLLKMEFLNFGLKFH